MAEEQDFSGGIDEAYRFALLLLETRRIGEIEPSNGEPRAFFDASGQLTGSPPFYYWSEGGNPLHNALHHREMLKGGATECEQFSGPSCFSSDQRMVRRNLAISGIPFLMPSSKLF